MKLLTIVGARPQFIKAALVSRQIKKAGIQEVIVHTGQHYDSNMSDVFFNELDIPVPQYNLGVGSGRHGACTGEMLEKIEQVIIHEAPTAVVVYGDTNSTLAGALAAKKIHFPLIHIEAGLRSFEMTMPEEINRVITDRISDILFCPTEVAMQNLKNEGFDHHKCLIVQSGDVMKDAALFYEKLSDKRRSVVDELKLTKYIVSTIHRSDNTDNADNLRSIVHALNEINKEMQVVMPLHPRTRKMMNDWGISCHFTIIDPVGYLDMVQLLKRSALVMTDSGGLQKEAFFFKKNCVVLRNETEWTELIDNGFNVMGGQNAQDIIDAYHTAINRNSNFDMPLYGDGHASEIIVNSIVQFFA